MHYPTIVYLLINTNMGKYWYFQVVNPVFPVLALSISEAWPFLALSFPILHKLSPHVHWSSDTQNLKANVWLCQGRAGEVISEEVRIGTDEGPQLHGHIAGDILGLWRMLLVSWLGLLFQIATMACAVP